MTIGVPAVLSCWSWQAVRTWAAPLALCGLAVALICDRPEFLITSDTLLPAAFVWDLLHQANAWSGFQQPRVPSFLPDLTIFGAIQVLTGSWRLAMAAWVAVVVVWLMAIGGWIVARIAGTTFRAGLGSTLAIALPLLALAAFGEIPRAGGGGDPGGYAFPFLLIAQPYTHGGPFLLALSIAALADRQLRWPDFGGLAAIGGLTAAAMLSDLLTVTALVVPLTAAIGAGLAVRSMPRQVAAALLAAVWAGAALGWVATGLLDRQPMPMSGVSAVPGHVILFLAGLAREPLAVAAILIAVMALTMDAGARAARAVAGAFWPVFAAVSAACGLAQTAVLYVDRWGYRYAAPLLWWAVILAAAALARLRPKWGGFVRGTPGLTVAVAGLLAIGHVPRLTGWSSPLGECLERTGLDAGLAAYWTARETSAATDWRIHVEQIAATGEALVWGNDRRWFSHDIHEGGHPPRFRFIVLAGLEPARIAAVYGPPDHVLACSGRPVWLYDDPDALYRALQAASPSVLPP